MIRLATIYDLDEIKELTEKCAEAMQQKGIFQWNEHYPSRERLENDILRQELYVVEDQNGILGIVVLTTEMDEEYIPVKWLTPNHQNLYIHRLASHPGHWGEGIGQKLMNFAESFASENHFISVRLDNISQNKRNQRFYEKRGYIKLENIFFPKQSEFPFYCYEKILN
ncbi:MAG TPA: GNAT family N-acetyltransferase [Salinimicrobium sp.]|nr:GNAT family N-acetyltransferase [Salinimicrobium sp.]